MFSKCDFCLNNKKTEKEDRVKEGSICCVLVTLVCLCRCIAQALRGYSFMINGVYSWQSLLYLSAIQVSDFIRHLNEKYSVIPILQYKLSRVTSYYIFPPYHLHSNFLAEVWYGKAGFSCTWHKASSISPKSSGCS